MKLLRVTSICDLIQIGFVLELVTLEVRLQNLGALDKEDPDTGVFFFIHSVLYFQ